MVAFPALRVSVESRDGWTVVRVVGELDYASWPELARELEAAVQSHERPRVAVDLSAVGFCDSSGLRCLAMAARRARSRNGEMLLLRPGAMVRRIIAITGLTGALPVAAGLPRASHVPQDR